MRMLLVVEGGKPLHIETDLPGEEEAFAFLLNVVGTLYASKGQGRPKEEKRILSVEGAMAQAIARGAQNPPGLQLVKP